jgi:hemerythrin superfamily protein
MAGRADTNIIDIIKEQHREFRELMDNVRDTTVDDPGERLRMFKLTRSKLNSHGRAEERVLFPRMEQDKRTRPAALEALEWHAASSNVMKGVAGTPLESELWLPKWLVARGIIMTHLDAEEARALERIREAFSPDELERLGKEFLLAEEEIIEERKGR